MPGHHSHSSDEDIFYFEQQEIVVPEFAAEGFILDIGGGGEGIIGLLKGEQVVAIDFHPKELEEAPPGPLKVIMDARDLKFLDESFAAATAFFSLMYLKNREDGATVLDEVYRVLRPGGQFLVWDALIPAEPGKGKRIYVVMLAVKVGEKRIQTGYGQLWPKQARDLAYYQELVENAGFQIADRQVQAHTFFLKLIKPEL